MFQLLLLFHVTIYEFLKQVSLRIEMVELFVPLTHFHSLSKVVNKLLDGLLPPEVGLGKAEEVVGLEVGEDGQVQDLTRQILQLQFLHGETSILHHRKLHIYYRWKWKEASYLEENRI